MSKKDVICITCTPIICNINTMKIISTSFISFFILLIANSLSAQDFWQEISSYQTPMCRDIEVDSQGRIYQVLYDAIDGGILCSDDNCATWQQKNNGLDYHTIKDLELKNDSNLFIVGDWGVFKSTDRANNWDWVYDASHQSWQWSCIKTGCDSVILVSGGREYGILRSTDGGVSWQVVLNLYNSLYWEYITDILFGPDNVIYACSRYANNWSNNNPKIYYSTDYGKTWSVFYDPQTPCGFIKLKFNNEGKLMTGAFDAVYMHDFTTDTWEIYPYNTIVSDFLVVPDNRVFLAGDNSGGGWGGVALSYDDGLTYPTILNSGLPYGDAKEFAVDNAGRILMHNSYYLFRSNDTIFTQIDENPEINHSIVKFYPNPFHEYLTMKSSTSSKLRLNIYNSSGQLIAFETLPSFGELRFDATLLPPGIYIVKLESKNHLQTYKLIHF